MRLLKATFFVTIMVFLTSSCTFYKPTVLTTPIVEEKGEVILGGSLGSTADAYLVVSPIQNIAIMAEAGSAYTIESTTTVNGEEISSSVSNLNYEFSVGYYDSLNSDVLYQIYAGYAFGKSGSLFEDAGFTVLDGLYSSEYTNPFIQASTQFRLNYNIYLGLSARANFLEFNTFETASDTIFASNSSIAEGIDDPSKFVGQFGIDFRYRGDKFGAFAGMQYAFSPEESGYFDVRNYGIHLGIYLRIDSFFRKD